MSLVWADEYDNEEELRKLSGLNIRSLYLSAPKDKKAKIAKVAAEKLINLDDSETIYDTLGNLNVVVEHNEKPENEKVEINYENIYSSFVKKVEAYDTKEGLDPLAECFDIKTLTTILKVSASKLNDELRSSPAYKNVEAIDTVITKKIETGLTSSKAFSQNVIDRFYMAEQAGALNNVSEDARNKFLSSIMVQTGWKEATKESIEAADKKLNDNIISVDVYVEKDGKRVLNPLFSECSELANSIAYEFPDGSDEASKKNLTNAYNQQLMANALQRATQDVLRNPDLLPKGVSREEIEAKFKNIIADNFSRSVIVAGLASSPNTTGGIFINSETGRAEYDNSDDILDDIKEVMNGTKRISPAAVNLDTHQLSKETVHTERMLDLKQVDRSKLPFFAKVKNVVKAAYNNVVKQGGWKKIAVNMAMFGGSAMAMASGATAVIAAGAAVYAGWTAANAWVAPVWDKLSAEMRERNITGFKNKWAYRLKNWKRAKEQKYLEPGFKERAAWRTVEGAVVGGITASLGLGGVGGWTRTLVRQGAMVVGKSASLAKSIFKRKTAAEKLAETYSAVNYKSLQATEGYLRQDKIALGSVVAGALIGDAVKLGVQEGVLDTASLNDKLTEVTEKVKGRFDGSDETPVEEVVETNDVVTPEIETTPEAETPETGTTPEAETPETETTPEVKTTTTKSIDINDLDNDHKKMFLNSHKKWENAEINKYIGRFKENGYHVSGDFAGSEKGIVQGFYNAIQNGQVESCPEGMSPVEYVDKLTRLMQLAPIEQKKGIELIIKDLMCEDFHPSDAEKQIVAETLNTIRYDRGTSQCVIFDDNGNPCVTSMPNFGNYFGKQQVVDVQLENGETVTLPVRTANVTHAVGANIDCEGGTGKISSVYVKNSVDCGCDSDPEPKIDPEPNQEPPCDCTDPEEFADSEDIATIAEHDVIAPKEEMSVNMQDPYARGTAIKSGKGSYYDVDLDTVNGKIKGFEGGTDQVWDKDGVKVTEEGYEDVLAEGRRGIQVELHNATDVTQIIDKLPDVPTNVIKEDDGSVTYLYEFKNGRDIRVVIDAPKEGETESVGHFLIGGKEIVIDKASSEALMEKMSKNTNINFTSLDGDEQKVVEDVELTEKIRRNKEAYYSSVIEDTANPKAPAEGAEFATPRISTEQVTLTAEQKTQIMSEGTEMTCVDIKDGKAILEIKGVEGVTRIAVAEPTSVNYNLRVMPETSMAEDGSYSVGIMTTDNKQMLVTIANGKATTTLDGKPVVLDTKSSEITQNLVNLALRKENVDMKVDLHTDFTEKVVKAVEAKNNTAQHSPVISRAQSTR